MTTADDDYVPPPTYTGLCIGGIKAGSWVTLGRPDFRCYRDEPVDLNKKFDPEATVEVHEYKWIVGFRHRVKGEWTDDFLNFWIPSNEKWNPLDCVRMMAEDYANYHDLRNS